MTLNADGSGNDVVIQSNGSTKAIVTAEGKVALGGSTAVTSDSQVAIHGGNLELTNAGAKYWIPRASDGVLTGSLYSPSGSVVRLSGAGTSAGTIEFEPRSSNGVIARVTGDGICFNGDTAAANALDDYEQGSFTPTVNVGTISGVGSYTKIGDVVTVWFSATTFSNDSSTSYITIGGLPFAGRSNMGNATCGSIMSRYTDNLANQVYVDGTNITFYGNTTGNWDLLRFNDINSGSFAMYGSATYGV